MLFVSCLNNEVVLFYVCTVCLLCNKTKWLLFAFCGLVFVVLFGIFIPLQKTKTQTQQKPSKKQNAEKHPNVSVSAFVFTNSVPNCLGWLQNAFLAENTRKKGFNAFCKTPKEPEMSNLKSQELVQA